MNKAIITFIMIIQSKIQKNEQINSRIDSKKIWNIKKKSNMLFIDKNVLNNYIFLRNSLLSQRKNFEYISTHQLELAMIAEFVTFIM